MAVRSLEQILSELGSVYNPQIDSLRQQQSAIPQQISSEEQGLQAKQTDAFDQILGGARRRGLGFSGIPLQEQARYTSTEFLPALARLRQSGRQQASGLEDAILGVQERRNTLANQLRQAETDNDLRERQFAFDQQKYRDALEESRRQLEAANRAARSGGGGGYGGFGGGGSGGGGSSASFAKAIQRGDKGFNFTDNQGRAISAAQYSALKGIPFRNLLQTMANSGDSGAKAALGFVGNDYGYDPRKITSQGLANLYNALVGGTGRKATYTSNGYKTSVAAPQPKLTGQPQSSLTFGLR